MAASPAKSTGAAADSLTPSSSNASKGQRGLNKPKCIKCGNVARSRCPYQSCKNCCSKAQNPCHIHVLKGNSSFPDKPPSSSSPLFDQQSTEVSHQGNFNRLRQLSSSFAQFSNLQTPLRSRKPLTKKDAQVINEWRFLKLKEFKDRNVEAETEAFDRYTQNAGLLEEVFLVNSSADDNHMQDEPSSEVNSSHDGQNTEGIVQGLKMRLGSNPLRSENLRKKIQHIVDQGLKSLGKAGLVDGTSDLGIDTDGCRVTAAKRIKSLQGEMSIALTDLNDKLNKARNEDDMQACWEIAHQMFRWNNNSKVSSAETGESILGEKDRKCDMSTLEQSHNKWFASTSLDREALCQIDAQFSSMEEIEDL
ncbi:electron carrier/ iron ion binding protein [Striga asiatica]|uniref:Electron carrier/ iron ion binding protein n=1 Tax=Striga asiatica TaxID=4170 RepID=A0A5A7PRE1_STRAF|nr:electron carrier/ iron ion binding protein [Striga asiatica]